MGNLQPCNYKPKRLLNDKLKEKNVFGCTEFRKLNDPFFNVNIRHRAIFMDGNNDDSIDMYNIQMTHDNEWVVSNREPKGSLLIGTEYDRAKELENRDKTYFNIQQAHSIKSQNVRLTSEASCNYNNTRDLLFKNTFEQSTSLASNYLRNSNLCPNDDNYES